MALVGIKGGYLFLITYARSLNCKFVREKQLNGGSFPFISALVFRYSIFFPHNVQWHPLDNLRFQKIISRIDIYQRLHFSYRIVKFCIGKLYRVTVNAEYFQID